MSVASKPVEPSPSMESLLHNPLERIQSTETVEIGIINESSSLQQALSEELKTGKEAPAKRSSNEPETGAATS